MDDIIVDIRILYKRNVIVTGLVPKRIADKIISRWMVGDIYPIETTFKVPGGITMRKCFSLKNIIHVCYSMDK